MRRLLIVAALGMLALPLLAAKRMTVAQLERTLQADTAAHKADAETARQLNGIELTERLTEVTLRRLEEQFASAPETVQSLLLQADQSAFLDPPAKELPAKGAPDAATQQHLLEAARQFALERLPRLPDLLATRTTVSFDDSPKQMKKGGWPERLGLHFMGKSDVEVSVRSEREGTSSKGKPDTSPARGGLITWGEFGATLYIILSDSANGKVTWSHWEQTQSGPAAVFHYEVPKEASHYQIVTPVMQRQLDTGSTRWAVRGGMIAMRGETHTDILHATPGYQGSLWVDPATGTIERVSLIPDLKGNPTFEHGAILVEYGPVQIADKTFICPVRSLALSSALRTASDYVNGVTTEWLNENRFTDYHVFGSTARIVTASEAPAPTETQNAAATTESAAGVVSQQVPVAAAVSTSAAGEAGLDKQPVSTEEPTSSPTVKPEAPAMSTPATAAAASAPASVPATETLKPTTETSAADLPKLAPVEKAEPPANSGMTLHVNVNSLLVPVVVRDKQGHAVGDLDKTDFTVLDEGKQKTITGFTIVKSTVPGEAAGDGGQGTASGIATSPTPGQNRFVIFLFDDRHLNSTDLAFMQRAAIRMLDEPLEAGEYADVMSFLGVNSGLTRDRAALQAAVRKLSVHQTTQSDARDCAYVDYYSAYKILRQHDTLEFQVAVAKIKSCNHMQPIEYDSSNGIDNPTTAAQRLALSAASRALAVGEEDARETLDSIGNVVRAMAKLPGQKTLIFVSPGFLSLSSEAMGFKSQVFDDAAASDVVINSLDARGLYTGNVDASQGLSATFGQTTGETSQDQLASMQMSEDAMSELAEGTGGKFFHNSNDLEGGLKSLAAAPEFVYLLEIPLKDVKANGAYHSLKVKVDKRGLDVQARKGYIAPKDLSRKK